MKIHYKGEIRTEHGGWLAGWAPCCTGERAATIRRQGNHTYVRALVTCERCKKQLAAHDAYAAKRAAASATGEP